MIRAVLLFLVVVVGCAAADLDALRHADALRLREGFRGVAGALGEEGPYQLREITWRQHMPGVPFSEARREGPARLCALRHIRWIAEQLAARELEVSPFTVAVAWNAGLERYLSGQAPVRAYLFAGDVEILYMAHKPQPSVQVELPLQVQGAATWRRCTACGHRKIAIGRARSCALPKTNGDACGGLLIETGPWDN